VNVKAAHDYFCVILRAKPEESREILRFAQDDAVVNAAKKTAFLFPENVRSRSAALSSAFSHDAA
jgi:hypothetical protein